MAEPARPPVTVAPEPRIDEVTLRGCALLLVLAWLPGCRTSGSSSPVPTESERGRFPHSRHGDVACTECHDLRAVMAGRPERPGADEHAPCDRDACHRTAFMVAPGPLCELCHTGVDPQQSTQAPLTPYPPISGRRALAASFSHERHLDFDLMEDQVGFHVSCTDCHALDEKGQLQRPDHAVCGRCHAPEASPPGAPTMAQCQECHVERRAQPSRLRTFIVGDLRFRHANHRQDRTGKTIGCAECHTETRAVSETGGHEAPPMAACVACHDNEKRTPRNRRMRVCETCHATVQQSIGAIAPRSHLPALERPEDHTRAFRRDHSAEAAAQPQRCARCHTFMSGSPRDTCDDCHRTMRPESHTVTWREFDHGPAAATRTENCATCHQAEFCIACHTITPRSHFPRLEFRNGGHGTFARFKLRSCMTCHAPDTDCTGPGCHDGGGM